MSKKPFNLQIRRATPSDAGPIANLLHLSFTEYKSFYTVAAFSATTPKEEQIIRRLDEGPIWVAVRHATIVGTVSVRFYGEALHIRSMAVHPAARGAKVGESLLNRVILFAIVHAYKRLFLSTCPFLTPAIRLYEKMGFKPNPKGPHDLHGTPLFTMEKHIRKKKEIPKWYCEPSTPHPTWAMPVRYALFPG